ncbi:DUF4838 domain-containing protein [Phycisphaerales bacterium AB-hyl4]|uniref:DUF4838 domain-containing protein n=1 Tax=Natronomicrosphaera hydrolytica TaxID=3242702 RepID=A0ABV4U5I7_9BACT
MPAFFHPLLALAVVAVSLSALTPKVCGQHVLYDPAIGARPIIVADDASEAELTAANELASHLGGMVGVEFPVVPEAAHPAEEPGIHVGSTRLATEKGLLEGLNEEAWRIRTVGPDLVLTGGGPRGVLYAVYHLLEDDLGVRWWTPWEKHLVARERIEIEEIDRQGEPAFSYRAINSVMSATSPFALTDGGAFVTRNRLNSMGPVPIESRYGVDGGLIAYPRPWVAHTLNHLLFSRATPQDRPEFFSQRADGTPDPGVAELMNPGLRQFVADQLRDLIATDRRRAEEAGARPPLLYHVSKADKYVTQSTSPAAVKLRQEQGAESAVLLDFVNTIGTKIAAEYPDVRIETLAYMDTETPPRSMNAAPNVVVTLADTHTRISHSITHPINRLSYEKLRAWSQRTDHLRLWLYGYTFATGFELPLPIEFTYAENYRTFQEVGAEGIMVQFEAPQATLTGDMGDFKFWLMAKLMEDPSRDAQALMAVYTDGYYGPAGQYILEYRQSLHNASQRHTMGYTWLTRFHGPTYHYLNSTFILDAQKRFDQAEAAVSDSPELLKRVRHARLSLDWATLLRHPFIIREWQAKGHEASAWPIDRHVVAERMKQTVRDIFAARAPDTAPVQTQITQRVNQIDLVAALRTDWPCPDRFDLAGGEVRELAPTLLQSYGGGATLIEDDQAVMGVTMRWPLPASIQDDTSLLTAGLWDVSKMPLQNVTERGEPFRARDVDSTNSGFYRIAKDLTLSDSSVLFLALPIDWFLQTSADLPGMQRRDHQKVDVWAEMRFKFEPTEATGGFGYLDRILIVPGKTVE